MLFSQLRYNVANRTAWHRVLITLYCLPAIAVTAETSGSLTDMPRCPDNFPQPPAKADTETEEIHVTADRVDAENEHISMFHGNVMITRPPQQINSATMRFNARDNTMNLTGAVRYWDDSIYFEADKAYVEMDEERVQLKNTRYAIKDKRGGGHSTMVNTHIGIETELHKTSYTTCDPHDPFWTLSASTLKLDHVENQGRAYNLLLKIKNIPIFYSPYLSFPLDSRRKTGFLLPTTGHSNKNGFEFLQPFYWNIAPHMDATLTPRLLSDKGLMLMGNFRHLTHTSTSDIDIEYLPSDRQASDRYRNFISLKHHQSFADTGKFSLDYHRVSDRAYFEDFGDTLGLTSTRFLEQRADLVYAGEGWTIHTTLQNYQPVDLNATGADRPYKRLPQISFNAHPRIGDNRVNYVLDSEITYFDRDDSGDRLDNVTGARLHFAPTLSYPYRTAAAFITPRLGLRYTRYHLGNTTNYQTNPDRLLPVLSIDSGAFFERRMQAFSGYLLHTLEPRLFYLYIPDENQRDLPIFDTGRYDFSFVSAFRENRFNGHDRLGDTNQVMLALTSRLLNYETGKAMAYLSFGQLYYLADHDVILPDEQKRRASSSPLLSEMGVTLSDQWRFTGALQWDPDRNNTEKLSAMLQYEPFDNTRINLSYRVRNTALDEVVSNVDRVDIEQSDVSFYLPLNRRWNAVGRWNYSFTAHQSLEIFGGIEYDSCCWSFKVIARRFLTDNLGNFETGFLFQFDLKGLSGIGRKTIDFLKDNVRGYENIR